MSDFDDKLFEDYAKKFKQEKEKEEDIEVEIQKKIEDKQKEKQDKLKNAKILYEKRCEKFEGDFWIIFAAFKVYEKERNDIHKYYGVIK